MILTVKIETLDMPDSCIHREKAVEDIKNILEQRYPNTTFSVEEIKQPPATAEEFYRTQSM